MLIGVGSVRFRCREEGRVVMQVTLLWVLQNLRKHLPEVVLPLEDMAYVLLWVLERQEMTHVLFEGGEVEYTPPPEVRQMALRLQVQEDRPRQRMLAGLGNIKPERHAYDGLPAGEMGTLENVIKACKDLAERLGRKNARPAPSDDLSSWLPLDPVPVPSSLDFVLRHGSSFELPPAFHRMHWMQDRFVLPPPATPPHPVHLRAARQLIARLRPGPAPRLPGFVSQRLPHPEVRVVLPGQADTPDHPEDQGPKRYVPRYNFISDVSLFVLRTFWRRRERPRLDTSAERFLQGLSEQLVWGEARCGFRQGVEGLLHHRFPMRGNFRRWHCDDLSGPQAKQWVEAGLSLDLLKHYSFVASRTMENAAGELMAQADRLWLSVDPEREFYESVVMMVHEVMEFVPGLLPGSTEGAQQDFVPFTAGLREVLQYARWNAERIPDREEEPEPQQQVFNRAGYRQKIREDRRG